MNYNSKAKTKSHRQLKVERLIQQELSLIINNNRVYHPIIEQLYVSITHVDVTTDLKLATIYIDIFNEKVKKDVLIVLNHLAPKYRFALGQIIKLKFSPEIRFRIDAQQKNLDEINQVWEKI